MSNKKGSFIKTTLISAALVCVIASSQVSAQLSGFGITPVIPEHSTVASIPSIRAITGRGEAWNSSPAQWPGYGIDDFDYEIDNISIVTDNHDIDVTEQLKDFVEKYFFN